MSFDLRLPIGLLFAVFGVILALDGLVAHRLVLDINVNLWWGVVLIVFGAAMLALATRSKNLARPASTSGSHRPNRGH
jgi:hypothetical protein